jgi:hypothetical protein
MVLREHEEEEIDVNKYSKLRQHKGREMLCVSPNFPAAEFEIVKHDGWKKGSFVINNQ